MTTEYKPGETVPDSGIYTVMHDPNKPHHEVTCIKGKIFPGSKTCAHPRYQLKNKAIHIDDHPDTKK
ncbi:hypothetical protein [Collimonas humicola]|uniref:hypothetical protein n=1 Tax=Collimonas humicola TaxID=2825886 RepID=UPI001B8C5D84|nr:hypothetical protein [Collimonas humicola]